MYIYIYIYIYVYIIYRYINNSKDSNNKINGKAEDRDK